jgi:cytochrome c-type biogenesis protein CcmH/NrfG
MSHTKSELLEETIPQENDVLLLAQSSSALVSSEASARVGANLTRMFRDPYQLEQNERTELIQDLRGCVELCPNSPELRVLLGMALCVDIQAQEAMEVLREAVEMAPNNFAARLKFGELLMRLRICDQAEEHTKEAARLASNDIQVELARNQAATIRKMMRNGIMRGSLKSVLPSWKGLRATLTPGGRGRAALKLNA